MHQWMERQRKKWEVTMRGKAKGVKGQKTKGSEGTRWRKVNGVGKQDADDTWINPWKRGGREYKGGLKSDLAQQYNWGSNQE